MASIQKGEKTTYTASRTSTGRVLEADTAKTLASMMRYDVEQVYGAWQFGSLNVCAKSGTAEAAPGQSPHAWFAGFVADEDLPLAFVVLVENGGGGADAAGPIAARLLAMAAG